VRWWGRIAARSGRIRVQDKEGDGVMPTAAWSRRKVFFYVTLAAFERVARLSAGDEFD
jgi:hypothetical protein